MKMKHSIEILAPAGGIDSVYAAVRCGADAVYLGAVSLNARRSAANFTEEQMAEAVAYCHLRGVRVYLTLNTLVGDRELDEAARLIEQACRCGIDAFIVQDLAVARLARDLAPDIRLHGSTQLSVMSPEGFQLLEELGFVRAVVPRELSLPEIRRIRASTHLELEAFVHGALCMCVSGQCYLSSILGGRSGNRGLCAQPCRLPFGAPGGTGHDLSLKDLDLIDHIPEMAAAGIYSFKIEGRMKRPEYVAAAVSACRNKADGIEDAALRSQLSAVFSRSGFTDGYLAGRRGRDMFGTRRKEDVTAAKPILQDLESRYAKEVSPTPLSLRFTARADQPAELTVSALGKTASAEADAPPEKAQNRAADRSSVLRHLEKTGGTPYTVQHAEVALDDGLFLPASELNALRRTALDRLDRAILAENPKQFHAEAIPKPLPPHVAGHHRTLIRLRDPSQYSPVMDKYTLIVPLGAPYESYRDFGVEIPRAQYDHTDRTVSLLRSAKAAGASFAFAGTIDGVALARQAGLPVLGSFTLNIFNGPALEEYHRLGVDAAVLSQELRVKDLDRLGGSTPRGLLIYGRVPLMLMRTCPVRNGTDCRRCRGTRSLTDRKGEQFPVVCSNGASDLLNSCPTKMLDRLSEIRSCDFTLLYFTVESGEEAAEIVSSMALPGEKFTRGLYYRGVL